MWLLTLLGVFLITDQTFADEVCCERIGCFNITEEDPMGHLDDPLCPDEIGVRFFLINEHTDELEEEFTLDNIPAEFDPTKLTIFTAHGWMGESHTDWMIQLEKMMDKQFDANVILCDWKNGADYLYYPESAANTQTVGAEIAYMIQELVTHHGGHFERMWCIGFSLGAHVCGHAGMRTNGQMYRVTGLDPAGPMFTGYDLQNGINPTSARFVDCIHTDGVREYTPGMGTLEARGHVDYYPNGGHDQPGCSPPWKRKADKFEDPDDPPPVACNHYRAPSLWLDSLKYENCFLARKKCNSVDQMPYGCTEVEPVIMGAHATNTTRGLYYLETAESEPYCLY